MAKVTNARAQSHALPRSVWCRRPPHRQRSHHTMATTAILLLISLVLDTLPPRHAFTPASPSSRAFNFDPRAPIASEASARRTALRYAATDPVSRADSSKRGGCPFLVRSCEFRTFDVPALFGSGEIVVCARCCVAADGCAATARWSIIDCWCACLFFEESLLRRIWECLRPTSAHVQSATHQTTQIRNQSAICIPRQQSG